MIDAILVTGTLALLALVGIAVARFVSSKLSKELILRSAAMAILIEMAVIATIYVGVTSVRGLGDVRLSWTTQIPTDASRLVQSGTLMWGVLRGFTVGFVVRGVAFAWMLRRYHDHVTVRQVTIVAAIASASVLLCRALLELTVT